jgi:hypothetical protein
LPDSVTAPIGIPKDANGNPHPLFLVGAGAVVLLGVWALAHKRSGAPGTTAAGVSINAALSSLEDQALQTQSSITKGQQVAAWRDLATLWAGNQVAYAGSENSTIATLQALDPNNPQIKTLQDDSQRRLENALSIWKQLGGLWPASGPTLDPTADLSNAHLASAGTGTF